MRRREGTWGETKACAQNGAGGWEISFTFYQVFKKWQIIDSKQLRGWPTIKIQNEISPSKSRYWPFSGNYNPQLLLRPEVDNVIWPAKWWNGASTISFHEITIRSRWTSTGDKRIKRKISAETYKHFLSREFAKIFNTNSIKNSLDKRFTWEKKLWKNLRRGNISVYRNNFFNSSIASFHSSSLNR